MSENLAYLAGLVDGEGYISINRQTHKLTRHGIHFHPVVKVANTDERMSEFFKERFGGCVEYRRSTNPRWKDSVCWVVNSVRLVKPCLDALLPYLRIKNRQAAVALALCARPHGKRGTGVISDAEFAERECLYKEVLALNRTGPTACTD